jgi:hypothetical protein
MSPSRMTARSWCSLNGERVEVRVARGKVSLQVRPPRRKVA